MRETTPPADLSSAIHVRLDAGDRRMSTIEDRLTEQSEATKRIEQNTGELVDAFHALTGAFKVLTWIGKAAKPLGWIAAAVAAVVGAWTAIKGGVGK